MTICALEGPAYRSVYTHTHTHEHMSAFKNYCNQGLHSQCQYCVTFNYISEFRMSTIQSSRNLYATLEKKAICLGPYLGPWSYHTVRVCADVHSPCCTKDHIDTWGLGCSLWPQRCPRAKVPSGPGLLPRASYGSMALQKPGCELMSMATSATIKGSGDDRCLVSHRRPGLCLRTMLLLGPY